MQNPAADSDSVVLQNHDSRDTVKTAIYSFEQQKHILGFFVRRPGRKSHHICKLEL